MPEATSLITSAFVEAVNQLTTFLGVGITAAISALLLDCQSGRRHEAELRTLTQKATPEDAGVLSLSSEEKPVKVSGLSIEVVPDTAKLLLIGAYFAAGILAYTTGLSALSAAQALHEQPHVLRAVCLQPGIATSPLWLRLSACCLPAGLIGLVMWRIYSRLKILHPTDWSARYFMPLVAASPYGALAVTLWKLPC